ncbi:MAG: GNAT family N-acetyltransferase [Synechococcaceae cyanobacterium]|nr:GNAT family N-acetyltransferase [Synechococcaceae cyanobacterium]
MTPSVERADIAAAAAITALTGELLEEIQLAIGERVFGFDAARNQARLEAALESGRCIVFHIPDPQPGVGSIALLAMCEGFALYAEGAFGIITELYVRPPHRGRGLGRALVAAARVHGRRLGWSRLEVTTPPLPAFARTLGFYEREGFSISGGRKLRVLL